MVIVLTSGTVDRGFQPRSGQTKDYKTGINFFYANHTQLRRNSTERIARYQDNVSKCGGMSIHVCCFSELALYKIQLSMLV
jgi:hypothetical protein